MELNVDYDTIKKLELIKEEINSLRLKGNEYFNKKDFVKAINYYNQALEIDPKNIIVLSNRSECFLKLSLFHSALSDSKIILEIDEDNLKALYKKGRALENLGNINDLEESIIVYKNLIQRLKQEENLELLKIIEEKLNKTESKIQNTQGKFILEEMYKEEKLILNNLSKCNKCDNDTCDKSSYFTELSCENYINTKLTISFDEIKGVTLIANQEISQGELLLVEKPIVCMMSEEKEQIIKFVEDNQMKIGNMDEDFEIYEILLNRITSRLKYPEEKSNLKVNLSHLFNKNNLKMNIAERQKVSSLETLDNSNIEEELRNIISYNSIVTIRNENSFDIKEICYGLWKNFSFLNHSCVPNAFYFGIGPYLILKSNRNVKTNEEITISYIEPKSFLERQFSLQKWDFVCNCELCLIEKNLFETDEYNLIKKKMEKIKIHMYKNNILSYGDLKKFFGSFNETNLKLIKKFLKWTEDIVNRNDEKLFYIKFLFFKSMAIIFYNVPDNNELMKDAKENKIFLFEKAIDLIKDFSIREYYELLVTLRDSVRENVNRLKLLDWNKKIENLQKLLYEI